MIKLSFEHHVRLNEAALAMENIVDHLTEKKTVA